MKPFRPPSDCRRQLELALEAYYLDGNHSFWEVFAETPRQAVAAFASKAEVFGVVDPKLIGKDRQTLHLRAMQLGLALVQKSAEELRF